MIFVMAALKCGERIGNQEERLQSKMMLIRTYLAPSKIHGIGVFAAQEISKDTTVWMFDKRVDKAVSHISLVLASLSMDTIFRQHAYKTQDHWVLCLDNACWMNHSEEPNIISADENWDHAAQDIYPGDELTINYQTFDLDWKEKLSA